MAAEYFSQYTSPNIVIVPQPSRLNEFESQEISERFCDTTDMNKFETVDKTKEHINPNLTYVQISYTTQDTPRIKTNLNDISIQHQESSEHSQLHNSQKIENNFHVSKMEINNSNKKKRNSIKVIKDIYTRLNETKEITSQKKEGKDVKVTFTSKQSNKKPTRLQDDKSRSLLLQETDENDEKINDGVDDIVKNIIKNSSLRKTIIGDKKEMNIELTINLKSPYKNMVDNKNNTKRVKDNLMSLESDVAFLEDFNVDEIVNSLSQMEKKNVNFDEALCIKEYKKECLPKIIGTENNASMEKQNLKYKSISDNTFNEETESNLCKGFIADFPCLTKNVCSNNVHSNKNYVLKKYAATKMTKQHNLDIKQKSLEQEEKKIGSKFVDNVPPNKYFYGPCTSKIRNDVKKEFKVEPFPVTTINMLDTHKINEQCDSKRQKMLKRRIVDDLDNEFVCKIQKLKVPTVKNHTIDKTMQTSVETLSKPRKYSNSRQINTHNTTKKTILIEPLRTNPKNKNKSVSDPKCEISKIKEISKETETILNKETETILSKEMKAILTKNERRKLKASTKSRIHKQNKHSANLCQSIRKYIETHYSRTFSNHKSFQKPHPNSMSLKNVDMPFTKKVTENVITHEDEFLIKNFQTTNLTNTLTSETDNIKVNNNDEDRSKTPEHIKKIIEYLESVEGNENVKVAKSSGVSKNRIESLSEIKSFEENDLVRLKYTDDIINTSSDSRIPIKIHELGISGVHSKKIKAHKRKDLKCLKSINWEETSLIKSRLNMHKNDSSKPKIKTIRNQEKDAIILNIKSKKNEVCIPLKPPILKLIDADDLQTIKNINSPKEQNRNTMLKPIQGINIKKFKSQGVTNDKIDSVFEVPTLRLNYIHDETSLDKNKKRDAKYYNRQVDQKQEEEDNGSLILKDPVVESNLNVKSVKTINQQKCTMSAKSQLSQDKACSEFIPDSSSPFLKANNDNDENKRTTFVDDLTQNQNRKCKLLENKESTTENITDTINKEFCENCIDTLCITDRKDNKVNINDNIMSDKSSNMIVKQENSEKKTPNYNYKSQENVRERSNDILKLCEKNNKNSFTKIKHNKEYNTIPNLSNIDSRIFWKLDKTNVTQYQKYNSLSNNSNDNETEIVSQIEALKASSTKRYFTINIDPVVVKSEFHNRISPSEVDPNYEIKKEMPNIQELSQVLKLRAALFTMLDDAMFLYFKKRLYLSSNLIREGSFSSILKCRNNIGQIKAVKILRKGYLPPVYKVLKEIQNTTPETNFHCIPLFHDFKTGRYWSIMMEYYPKNLQEALHHNKRSFCIDIVQDLFRQLVTASFTLKCNGIIHSDINPRHIMLNYGHNKLKLCGFDQSNMEAYYKDSKNLLPTIGTLQYRSPEIILGILDGINSGHSIDVWSIACVIYEMVTNHKLFYGDTNGDILLEQLNLIGNMSQETINKAVHRNNYFPNGKFLHKLSTDKEAISVECNTKSHKIFTSIMDSYFQQWAEERNIEQRFADRCKLIRLNNLISTMLVMEPKNRITIEFVMANSFIYK